MSFCYHVSVHTLSLVPIVSESFSESSLLMQPSSLELGDPSCSSLANISQRQRGYRVCTYLHLNIDFTGEEIPKDLLFIDGDTKQSKFQLKRLTKMPKQNEQLQHQ